MKTMRKIIISIIIGLTSSILICYSQNVSQNYLDLQSRLTKGWNTWSYGSMLTHVLLPDGLALKLNLRQAFIGTPGDATYFMDVFTTDTSDLVQPVAHSFDGAYTELVINNWKGNSLRVQSAASGKDIVILITPLIKSKDLRYNVELEAGMMWNKKGNLEKTGDFITASCGETIYRIHSTNPEIESYHSYMSPYLVCKGDTSIGFYTGNKRNLDDVVRIIELAKYNYHNYAKKFGDLAEAFEGIQTVLSWNTIYDAGKNRVISPVTRGWNEAWQGFVLFEWDTYFASFLFALDNKDLAYSNAIAITKGINNFGFIGQWQMPNNRVANSISQLPIGSMICWMIYEKYGEKWFLEEVYNELLSWNSWWLSNRMNKGFLTWGCGKDDAPLMASLESGLDNSPMYEDTKMDKVGNNFLFNIADVGLNSTYISDCKFLAKMANVLGKTSDEKKLLERAQKFTVITHDLWDNNSGIFLNKFLDKAGSSKRLSPTLFYPMMANIASKEQAKRMIKEHFYNKDEFYGNGDYLIPSCPFNDKSFDNNYWRGSIWGPMNFLVYLGLRNYDKQAATELADKSYNLYLKAWSEHGCVFENINSKTGVKQIKDQLNSNPFYHWGALMGIMKFMEKGVF